jgi:pimeloyl-ACP methyl ester carboxylesterase
MSQHPSTPKGLAVAIAVHCSGGTAAQWNSLKGALRANWILATPELYNCGRRGAWDGLGPFSLDREADLAVALIDQESQPVHLVGHSFGGSVALQAALRRPEKVASLTLYEPTAFQLLRHAGHEGRAAHAEIGEMALDVETLVAAGDYHGAAERFVDYWNGKGAWERLSMETRRGIAAWAIKAPLDFRAIFTCPTGADDLARLTMPSLVISGGKTPLPTRMTSQVVAEMLPNCQDAVIAEAGHMGPVTHRDEVTNLFTRFLEDQEARRQRASTTRRARSTKTRSTKTGGRQNKAA